MYSEALLSPNSSSDSQDRWSVLYGYREFGDVLAAHSIGAWQWNLKEDCLLADMGLARMLGIEEDEAARGLAMETFTEAIHEDQKWVVEKIDSAIRNGSAFAEDYRVIDGQGTVRWIAARGYVETDETSEPLRFPGVIIDITDRRSAQEAYRGSEERFKRIQAGSPEGFSLLKSIRNNAGSIEDFEITYANLASEKITRRPSCSPQGKKLLEEFPGNREGGSFADYVRVMETGTISVSEFTYDDGTLKAWFQATTEQDSDGCAILFTDISE